MQSFSTTFTRRMLLFAFVGSLFVFVIPSINGQSQAPRKLTKTIMALHTPASTPTPAMQVSTVLAKTYMIMQENFEGAWPNNGWQVENLNPVNPYIWVKRICPAHTGTYGETVAITDRGGNADCSPTHPNDASVAATYGPFDLSTSTTASMTFYLIGRTSTATDANGNPLDSLFVGSSINGQNFAGTSYFGDYTNGSDGNGYTRLTFDLTNRAGQSQVWITFWFESDSSGNDMGFTIDDVSITAGIDGPTSTPTASPTPTPFKLYLPSMSKPRPGRIVYMHHQYDIGYWLYTINPDGTDKQQVVSCQPEGLAGVSVISCGQTWSPDGTRIAFHSRLANDASIHLYIVNADGTNLTRLTNDDLSNDGFPVWSPDGNQIAFVRNTAGDMPLTASIYTINLDGTNLTRVTQDGLFWPIDWSSVSKRIAYSCVIPEHANTGLCTIQSDGQNRVIVIDDTNTTEMGPSWSPDGQRIAYVNAPNGATTRNPNVRIALNMGDLHIVNADGTNDEILVHGVAESRGGTWSPDGRIVFAYRYGQAAMPFERSDLYMIEVDGAHNSKSLTNYDGIPTWQRFFDVDPDWS